MHDIPIVITVDQKHAQPSAAWTFPSLPVALAAPLSPVALAAPLSPVALAAPLSPVALAAPLSPVALAAPLSPVALAAPRCRRSTPRPGGTLCSATRRAGSQSGRARL